MTVTPTWVNFDGFEEHRPRVTTILDELTRSFV
jgi:hypothetical protein